MSTTFVAEVCFGVIDPRLTTVNSDELCDIADEFGFEVDETLIYKPGTRVEQYSHEPRAKALELKEPYGALESFKAFYRQLNISDIVPKWHVRLSSY